MNITNLKLEYSAILVSQLDLVDQKSQDNQNIACFISLEGANARYWQV